jgi:hypothetical protein
MWRLTNTDIAPDDSRQDIDGIVAVFFLYRFNSYRAGAALLCKSTLEEFLE